MAYLLVVFLEQLPPLWGKPVIVISEEKKFWEELNES
jgi:hypothetical protein